MIEEYINQTITITPKNAHNRYGEAAFGTPVASIPARVQYQQIIEGDSNTNAIRAYIYCKQDVSCPLESKVTISGTDWFVNAVNKYVDLDGSFEYMRITVNRTYQNVN